MNKFFKGVFNLYQLLSRSNIASCRFQPTCSQYLLDATNKYGALKGTVLAIKRILSCHPMSTRPYYDPA